MKTIQKFANALALGKLATAPSNSVDGTIYYDTTVNKFRIKQQGAWTSIVNTEDLLSYYTKVELDAIIASLTTDDIEEGSTNLYFTEARAKAAAVVNSTAGSQIDQAASVQAMKDYVAAEVAAAEVDLSNYYTKPEVNGLIADEAQARQDADALLIPLAQKGAALGVATLDASGKLTPAQAPAAEHISYSNTVSGLSAGNVQTAIDEVASQIASLPDPITYKGTYDAATNTPTLSNSDVDVAGHLYRVTVAGVVDFGAGPVSLDVGDSVVNNGTSWEKWDHSDQVLSVNGQTGAVVLTTTEVTEGSNLYFTEDRVRGTVLTGLTGSMIPIAATDTILEALGKAKAQIESKIGAVIEDTSPQLGGNLKTGTYKITAETNPLLLEGDSVRRSAHLSSEFIEEEYVPSISIPGTTTGNTLFVLDSTFDSCEIVYKIKTTAAVRIGKLMIVSDGTNAYITETYNESSELNVDFDVVVNIGQVELKFDNNLTASVDIKMDVKKFLA